MGTSSSVFTAPTGAAKPKQPMVQTSTSPAIEPAIGKITQPAIRINHISKRLKTADSGLTQDFFTEEEMRERHAVQKGLEAAVEAARGFLKEAGFLLKMNSRVAKGAKESAKAVRFLTGGHTSGSAQQRWVLGLFTEAIKAFKAMPEALEWPQFPSIPLPKWDGSELEAPSQGLKLALYEECPGELPDDL